MTKRFAALLCLFALLLPTLTGCMQEEEVPGSEVTDLLQSDAEEPPTPAGSILPEVFSIPFLPGKPLDPITCQEGMQQVVSSLLCEGLFRLTPELEPHPWLCSSYHYDPETYTYTLTLRDGVSFSDGTPLTAADVKATLDRARRSERYASRLAEISTITTGDNVVTITLVAPNSGFISLLDIPIVKQGTENDAAPTGTGPYLYSDAAGSSALIANQLWWRKEEQPVDRIALVETADMESLRYRLTSHDIQLVTADLTGTDPITATGNIVYQDVDTTIFQYIGLNTAREPLNDLAFRSTLSKGLNHDFLVNAFLSGHAVSTQFPVSPRSSLYPAGLEKEYSLTAFSQALAALGTIPQQPLVLLVNEENSFKVSLAGRLAADYTAAGLPMEVRALPWEAYTAALLAGEFDLYYGEVKLTADWDLSALLGTGGALNYGSWSNPQTDAYLSAYASATDRAAAMEKLCSHLQLQNPILPICFKRTSVLMQSKVVDGLQSTMTEPFYGLSDCTIHLKEGGTPPADTAEE